MRRSKGPVQPVLGALVIALLVAAAGRPAAAWAAPAGLPPGAAGSSAAGPGAAAISSRAGMRLLVTFRPGATAAERADAVHGVGGRVEATIDALGVTRIALPGDADDVFADGAAVAAALSRHAAVATAELDASVRLTFDPNDQYYRTDPFTGGLGQWGIRKAQVDKAWDVVRGSASVTVAVLDTGVDPGHPDLSGVLVAGPTFVTQPSSECDPSVTRDDNSHGTHVAGVIGANGNNGAGIAGVAFGVKVMALKVLDCTGQGNLSDVALGLVYAVDHGARIVNLSLGSGFDSRTLHSAIDYATAHNVLVVVAAGNCGTSGSSCTSLNQIDYPAAYPDVVTVGATDTDDTVAFFSSRNSTVDVSAPGRRIVSTTPAYPTYLTRRSSDPVTPSYASFSGTSQAAPFVSGLAALILSGEPSLTATQLYDRIRTTADDLGAAGRDDGYGSGRVNALRAVTSTAERYGVTYDSSALPKSAAAGKAFAARVVATNTSSFAWRSVDPNAVRLDWSWVDLVGKPVAGFAGSLPLGSEVAIGALGTFTGTIVSPPTAGPFTLRLDLGRGTTTFSSKGALPVTLAVAVGAGIGATYAPVAIASSFDAGATAQIAVTLTNTGTETWTASGPTPVRLAYHLLQGSAVVVWDGQRGILAADVPAGAKAIATIPVLMPPAGGTYTIRIDLVQEGVAWFSGLGAAALDVTANVRSAYLATYTVPFVPLLLPGGRITLPVAITNTGTATWPAAGSTPVHLAAHLSDTRGNVVVWDGARATLAADVAPGTEAKADLVIDAPLAAGAYRVKVDLVREGVAWFSGLGVATSDSDLLVVPDFRAQVPQGPLAVSRAAPVAQVTIKNTSVATWSPGGVAPVDIGVHWYDPFGVLLLWDGPRTPLASPVAPNETVTLAVQLGPPPPGAAFVAIDPVSEGVAWFGQGQPRAVTFTP